METGNQKQIVFIDENNSRFTFKSTSISHKASPKTNVDKITIIHNVSLKGTKYVSHWKVSRPLSKTDQIKKTNSIKKALEIAKLI